MKKTVLLLLSLPMLAGCSKTEYSPVIRADFSLNAVYEAGDFSYSCVIERMGRCVSVRATDTYAKGMTVTCDGKNVAFSYDDMEKTLAVSDVNPTNPCVVLYHVFDDVCTDQDSSAVKIDGGYQYTGTTPVGEYTLVQNEDNTLSLIVIPDAGVRVTFKNT